MKQFNAMQYLAIDVANNFGLDKLNYEDRINWVKTNIDKLEQYQEKAEEPLLYYKSVRALRDALAGKAINHSVAFDSACSGLQLMSVLMRCKSGCEITGLIDPNNRKDAYTLITERMNGILKANDIDGIVISRKEAKEAVMTGLYGSLAVPKRIFGKELLPYFYQALEEMCQGAMQLLEMLRASWDSYAYVHYWVLPDGHTAYVPVTEVIETRIEISELGYKPVVTFTANNPKDKGISNIANVVHSIDAYVLRSLVRRCNYNKSQINRFLEMSLFPKYKDINLNIESIKRYLKTGLVDISTIQEINIKNIVYYPTEMINELRRICKMVLTHKPFEIICIHDSFACHPNNMNQLRMHYNEILAELSDSQVIDDILQQLYGDDDYVERGESISKYIRNSNYGIC